jgi:hypothetical protein
MITFIPGLVFFVIGLCLLIHRDALVSRSNEFRSRRLSDDAQVVRLDRILCAIAGLVIAVSGFLTMLFGN